MTIEDETGDVQLIVWPRVFARYKRELGNHVLLAKGVVSRHDGTTNVTLSSVRTLDVGSSDACRPRLALSPTAL